MNGINTKYWLVILVVVAIGGFGYLIWDEYFNPEYLDEFAKFEKQYVQAMTADTYGGSTPQATLDLFIDALKKEDADLAAKYFMLDDNLSRDKWIEALGEMKAKGLLDDMARDLEKAKPDLEGKIDENDFKFAIFDNGVLSNLIDMQFNTYSKVWKIENL